MKSADGSFEDDNFMRQIEFMNAKKIHKKRFEQVLESKMVEIRMLNSLKKMDINDVLFDGDKIFGTSFTPWQAFSDEIASDPQLPGEIRAFINQTRAQPQNQELPVFDAASSKYYTDLNEF